MAVLPVLPLNIRQVPGRRVRRRRRRKPAAPAAPAAQLERLEAASNEPATRRPGICRECVWVNGLPSGYLT
jgi:hypothetical protein